MAHHDRHNDRHDNDNYDDHSGSNNRNKSFREIIVEHKGKSYSITQAHDFLLMPDGSVAIRDTNGRPQNVLLLSPDDWGKVRYADTSLKEITNRTNQV